MAELRDYWDKVARLGCCITRSHTAVTIHHVHGGSVRGLVPRGRGMKLDWLVIPLCAELHTGALGIDSGMPIEQWEARFGRQLDMLLWVEANTGVDAFAKHHLANPARKTP